MPIAVTDVGIVKLEKALQSWNELIPIDEHELEILTIVRLDKPANIKSGNAPGLLFKVIDFKLVHPEKILL